MAAKIVFAALVALLAIQGINSLEVKRDLLSYYVGQVKADLDKLKTSLDSVIADVKTKFQEIKDKADQALSDAKTKFADLAQKVQDKIDSLQDKIATYGSGVKTCVDSNKAQALATITQDSSEVNSCITSVVNVAVPIVKNATDAVTNFVNLYNEIAPILTTCLPSSGNPAVAIPCFVAQGVTIAKQAGDQIAAITADVKALTTLAPELKTDIDNCSAEVKQAQTDVNNIIQNIQSCVDDYVNNSTTTTTAASA